MQSTKLSFLRSFLLFLVIALSASTIAGVLCFGYGVTDTADNRPIEAATWSGVTCPVSYNITNPYTGRYSSSRAWSFGTEATSGNGGINSSYSSFMLSYNATVNDVIEITYKASSEGSRDYLMIYANNTQQTVANNSGNNTSYSTFTYTVTTAGNNTFEFTYIKDGSVHSYDDKVYISSIVITPSYKIAFNSNSGSACDTQYIYPDNAHSYGTLPTPTKTGNTFMGWFKSSSFSGSPVTTSTTVTSSHTLYAKWQASLVTFVSNGGSACAQQIGVANSTYTSVSYGSLPSPTKDGYTFYGWYRESNFTGPKMTNSTTYTADHTLYARWGVIININLQGGQGITSILTPYNEPMETFAAPTMTGFTFAGYFTQPLGKAVQYYNSGMQSAHTCDLVQGTTLYACWQSTLNLDLQGGTGDTSVIAIYNDNMPEIMKPIRSGYTFGGYFTGKNGTGTRYYTNSMASSHLNDLPNGTTLYAYWMINTYILYYNPNGGTVGSTEASVTFGSTVTPPTPTRTGYTFFGWYIEGERYSGGIWTYTENKTATAKWGYTLTYNANGGYVLPGSVTLTDGDVITPPVPVRLGCTFAGWQIGGTAYNGGLWAYNANQTATAQWVCELNVSLNNSMEGSFTGTASGYYTAGSNFTVTATPATGYVFDHWLINNAKYMTATYSGALNAHTTAVAFFTKAQPTANVYATNGTIASTYLNIEPDDYSATLRITPEAGKYVQSISFDNVAFYTIDSWSTTLYASSSFAQNVAYRANEGNNNLWLTFNYYDTNKTVNVYVNLTTTPYSNLNVPKNTGGALDGIAVSANYGGSVTLVGADYETLADSDEIICTAKLAQSGYEFVGWVFVDAPSMILSTDESTKFTKATIYGRQLMAKFQPTADNADYNMDLNN